MNEETKQPTFYRRFFLFALIILILTTLLASAAPSSSTALAMSPNNNWQQASVPGFGDRHNSVPWSMQWWRGHLYVGTLRSFVCWRAAIWASAFPKLASAFYPPNQPDADCTASPTDLPMQAEIWRWTPETDSWERVYQSPLTVPIPDHPGRFMARDTGFRGMLVFTETNGTEALYVMGVSPREMYGNDPNLPPPRLLRSTDGINFTAVPQDPNTYMGDLALTGLRSGTIHNGRMYLTNGAARGEGILIESADPATGNNSFHEVMPAGTIVWDAISYNGFLYVGIVNENGFSVVKSAVQGSPPYEFVTVIPEGGYLSVPSKSIVSFQIFKDSLYVGTYYPAELYRIHSDDTWDLLVGEARSTPTGWKYPLSGLAEGFGWPFNVQIYRMHAYNGELYLGTLDVSREITEAIPNPELDAMLSWQYGFDLYRTVDGQIFEPVTVNGFNDEFQIVVRTFSTNEYGLFMGTGSYWYGLKIWRLAEGAKIFLPFVTDD